MAYDPSPQSFFGPGYSLASSEIKLKTADAAGITTGTTVNAEADTDVLTTASPHNLKVGDRIRFTEVGTLPTGISAGTDYYVLTTPSTTTLTISAAKGGVILDITADGSLGDNTMQCFGPLEEITDTEANASTGDWRKVLYGLLEMLHHRHSNMPIADRSENVSFTRSSSIIEATGEIRRFYSIQITTTPTGVEVSDE